MNLGRGALIEVIAVHGDIQTSGRDGVSPNRREKFAEAFGERQAAALDADEHDQFAGFVALGDLVGDAGEGALNRHRVQEDGGFGSGEELHEPMGAME